MKLAVLILVAFALSVTVAHADHSMGVKWPGQRPVVPVILAVSSDINPICNCSWESETLTAIWNWNLSTAVHLNVVAIRQPCAMPFRYQGILICNFNLPGWYAGFTEWNSSGPNFRQVVSYLNDAMIYPSRAVACHEMGHALGLDAGHFGHGQPFGSHSCMSNDWDAPNFHDYEQLSIIYR